MRLVGSPREAVGEVDDADVIVGAGHVVVSRWLVGFLGPLGAMAIGAAAGLICFWALKLKFRFGFDDSLDVIAVHVVGSIIGLLLVGVLADSAVTDSVAGWDQLGRQALSIVIAFSFSFSFVVSYALVKAIDVTMGIRVSEDEERAGLDITLHEEQSYVFGE